MWLSDSYYHYGERRITICIRLHEKPTSQNNSVDNLETNYIAWSPSVLGMESRPLWVDLSHADSYVVPHVHKWRNILTSRTIHS